MVLEKRRASEYHSVETLRPNRERGDDDDDDVTCGLNKCLAFSLGIIFGLFVLFAVGNIVLALR